MADSPVVEEVVGNGKHCNTNHCQNEQSELGLPVRFGPLPLNEKIYNVSNPSNKSEIHPNQIINYCNNSRPINLYSWVGRIVHVLYGYY